MLRFVVLSVVMECHFAECRYAKYRYADWHYAKCRYAECQYAECRYAECRYAECHGDNLTCLITHAFLCLNITDKISTEFS